MPNTLKIKRSAVSGKVPLTTDLQLGELALNTYDGRLFTKKNNGTTDTIVEIGAGAALADGDKGDITVSSVGSTWTIDAGVVNTTKMGGDVTTAGKALLTAADAAAQRTALASAGTGVSNSFTANQIISVTDNTNPALRITQLGSAAALRVEDEASETTPFVVTGTGSVGIGTGNTVTSLTLNLNSSFSGSLGSGLAFPGMAIIGDDASGVGINFDSYGSISQLTFRRANGTISSPSALTSGDVLGSFTFRGYGASAYSSGNRGLVQLVAAENWTNTAQGTYWQFNTVASGGTSSTEKLRIADNGVLTNKPSYDNTVAGNALQVTSTGVIGRTSSSIKYKTDVETLDHSLADNAIENLRPVWYRTKNPVGDDKATWSHIGLIAEEVDQVEKRLVKYRTATVSFDADGNRIETLLATPEPEDVDYARLSVLLLDKVKRLEARIAALESA